MNLSNLGALSEDRPSTSTGNSLNVEQGVLFPCPR